MHKKIIWLMLAVAAAMLSACGSFKSEESEVVDTYTTQQTEGSEISSEEPPITSEATQDTIQELLPLKTSIENELHEQNGDWAVYVENLATGSRFSINNHKMVSASVIKLFIMGSVCREVNAGNIAMSEVDSDIEKMITISDNESSNILVSKLGNGKYTDMYSQSFRDGLVKVNDFAMSFGCINTEQQRDMKDSRPVPVKEQNYTSVEDCGRLLSFVYNKKLVSPELDENMLDRMKRQTRRGKIPAGIPSSVVCANKTGELSDTENDVAIVFSPACDYIICVMSNDLSDTSYAKKKIAEISRMTYQFFNPVG